MIRVPSFVTAPVMGGAYGPSLSALSGIGGLGDDASDSFNWAGLATDIAAGATAATKVITATQGCPIGLVMNPATGQCAAPVIGATGIPGAAVGTIATPLGSAALGVSGTTIAMMALAGLVVLVLVMKK